MTTTQYQINSRILTAFSPLNSELSFDPHKNYLFDLSYLTGLPVVGERAHDFLQGQLSCDVKAVTPHQMRQGALCNVKGRILALLDVVQWGAQALHLILPHDLFADTQTSLNKTAMLSRVNLNATPDYHVLGFYLNNPDDLIPLSITLPTEDHGVVQDETYCCYHLVNKLYLLLVKKNHLNSISAHFTQHHQWRGSLAWHALQLHNGQVDIYPSSRGLFLPHRLSLHLSGHVSFNKGCYKGQEIIARMHYRATLKHTLAFFTITTQAPLQSGQTILSVPEHVIIGELIDYCPIAPDHWLIAASMVFDYPTTLLIEGHEQAVISTPLC